ncbi:hypothetical protein ACFQ60_22555 [Streptomyces zhihengii]
MSGDVRWTVAVSAAAWIGLVIVVFRIVPPVVRLVRKAAQAALQGPCGPPRRSPWSSSSWEIHVWEARVWEVLVPDVVAYLVLAVLLAVACVVAVVAGLLLLAAWRWGQGAVALVVSERRTARLRAALVAELADPGQVYLPCHTPCAGTCTRFITPTPTAACGASTATPPPTSTSDRRSRPRPAAVRTPG